MIIDLTRKLMPYIVLIAIVSMTITWAFNIQNMLVREETINGITIKTFNLRIYLQNLSNIWETNALNFKDIIPSREMQGTNNNMLTAEYWNTYFNNLACVADWIYFPLNFLLYILRWVAWIFRLGLAIIGWNTMKDANGVEYSNLIGILNWITQNLMIPYI